MPLCLVPIEICIGNHENISSVLPTQYMNICQLGGNNVRSHHAGCKN